MLRFDRVRKTYSAEIKHRTFGRVHLRLKTKVRDQAMRRHTALEQLLDTGEPVRDLVEALRARKLTIAAVEECVRTKVPFDTLRPSTWPTLGEARERYLKALDAKEQGSARTGLGAQTALTHAVAFFGEGKRLEAITHDDVAEFKAHLVKPKVEGGFGLHSNTVSTYLTTFGALYTFLQERETKRARQQKRMPATLFSPIDREEHVPRKTQTRVRFLAESEAQLVLAATPASIECAIALGLFAGLRIGEVLMLRPMIDVDLSRGVLFIQAREGWQPKYGKNREVPISTALRPYIERHLVSLPLAAPYVFPSTGSGPQLGPQAMHAIVRRVVADAGLEPGRKHPEGITFHTLRHTFASWLVMAGADLLTISKLMGHRGIRQVEETYGHLSPQHLQGTVELLSSRWFAAPMHTGLGNGAAANQTPQETP